MTKAADLYRAGQLSEAVAAQNDEVRNHPTDIERRSFLAELLCLSGNLDRADAQCATIEKMDPGSGPGLNLLRQLIRAEKSRQEVHQEGRVPEFLSDPPAYAQTSLRAMAAVRAGDGVQAAQLAAEAEEGRGKVRGKCGGEAFEDFRDLDDLLCGVLEVLTSTGRYMWIPVRSVMSLEFDAPLRPLDLLWRPAMMSVRNGPEGKVYLPAIYAYQGDVSDDSSRLGRRTDWVTETGTELTRGVGLRTFLVGDDAKTILELEQLTFED